MLNDGPGLVLLNGQLELVGGVGVANGVAADFPFGAIPVVDVPYGTLRIDHYLCLC
jgi:hypothetical protein